jgi:DNA-binding CsgD family transcriptional regulator
LAGVGAAGRVVGIDRLRVARPVPGRNYRVRVTAGLTHVELVRWWGRHARGLSIRQIADAQGVTEGAVKLSLRSAQRKIRRAKQEAA